MINKSKEKVFRMIIVLLFIGSKNKTCKMRNFSTDKKSYIPWEKWFAFYTRSYCGQKME